MRYILQPPWPVHAVYVHTSTIYAFIHVDVRYMCNICVFVFVLRSPTTKFLHPSRPFCRHPIALLPTCLCLQNQKFPASSSCQNCRPFYNTSHYALTHYNAQHKSITTTQDARCRAQSFCQRVGAAAPDCNN